MEARARKFSSIKSIFALLTVNLLASSTAEYVHRHHHGIQSRIHVHPRFGDRSIRYCAFNQYFDDREGRCMIIPGGGIAISIDDNTTCSTEALRAHRHRSRNYYICRKSNTILAECGRGKRFENRLKRCTIDANPSIDEEDYHSHHHPYDHLHLPACRRSGRFPVPQDNCTSFYTCTSNGFRFFRSIHKCPPSTGFDPVDKICTTERACDNDDLRSTTAADDRAKIFESVIGLIVAKTRRLLDKVLSIHTPKENYSLNKSTTKFTATSASLSPSTSGYDETKISVSFVTPNTFTTKKITAATSLPDSIDEVVGIARATRPTTEVYEHGGETSPLTSTTYVHSFGLSEATNTSERSTIAFTTNQIVDTSTADSVLSDNESTVNTSGTTDGILSNKYSDDYVTLRSDNAMRRRTKIESSTDAPVTISTNNRNYEFTVATNDIVDTSTTNSVLPETESTANTHSTNSDKFRQLSTNNKNDEFTGKTTIDDLRTRERDETRTSEPSELGIGLQVSYSTESAVDNASEKWLFDKNIEGTTSTIADEITQRGTTERELGTSLQVLLSGATSDATTRDIQYKEAQSITTPSVDSYASSGEVSSKMLSSDGIGDTSISPTEIVDSTPVTLTSLTPRSNEATSIPETNWTTEEESTIADRYHGSFSSFSTDWPDNEKSTTDGAESRMSTTEPTSITEVTEKFESTPVTLTSLTPRNDEATSIQESNWTTEEESTIADRYHGSFTSFSTDRPDSEKSTTDGAESTMSTIDPTYMPEVTEKFDSTPVTPTSLTPRNDEATSTTEPEFISEVTEKFGSTPVSPTSLTTRNNEVTSTSESEYISEVTEKFDSTPVSPTSLTSRSNEATSIAESNWTTEEESTIADRYHGSFSSFSTDRPDNEKSTTDGAASTMSTIEPTYMTEVTERFDSTPVTPNSLTPRNNEATSTTESEFVSEVTEKFDSTPVTPNSLTPRNNEATSTTESEFVSEVTEKFDSTSVTPNSLAPRNNEASSTTEPEFISDVTEEFDSTPVSPTSLTTRNNEATSTSESEHISEVTEKFDSTPVSPTSLTTRSNEATSNTEPEFISEVTEKFDSTPVALTSLTTRNNEAMRTAESKYISEVTEKFDSTPVSPTSLATQNNEATSIQDSNWTTEEEYTIADRHHGTFSPFSIDTPDDEESTSPGPQSTMSTTEPVHISEVTERPGTHSGIVWKGSSTEDLVTPIEQHQSTTGENSYQSSTYTENSASGASQFDIAQTTEDSNPDMNVAVSTTSITPSASSEPSQLVNGQAQGWYTTLPHTFSSFFTDTADNEKSTTAGTESEMSTAEPVHISEMTEKAVTYSKITSPDNLLTTIEEHQSTTGENSYQSFTYTENSASGASQFDIAQTTEDSNPDMNVAVSTTSITPSASSEPSQLVNGQAQGWYTTVPHTFSSFFTDAADNEKSTTAGTESEMSIAEPVHISEITEKAVTYSKSTSPDNLLATIEQHQSTTGENPYPAFTYTQTFGASQFDIAQTTEDSNPDMNVAVSTTSITPSVSSEPSQLQNGQAQGSYTSASNSSEYQTTVEPTTGSANSLSTTIPSSSDRA